MSQDSYVTLWGAGRLRLVALAQRVFISRQKKRERRDALPFLSCWGRMNPEALEGLFNEHRLRECCSASIVFESAVQPA